MVTPEGLEQGTAGHLGAGTSVNVEDIGMLRPRHLKTSLMQEFPLLIPMWESPSRAAMR
jgi:hypothetical protein